MHRIMRKRTGAFAPDKVGTAVQQPERQSGRRWPRWMDARTTAAYLCCGRTEIWQLIAAGKLPQPSCHLSPRMPRWDRNEIDSFVSGRKANEGASEEAFAEARAPPPERERTPNGQVWVDVMLITDAFPGTPKAMKQGCTCPILTNRRGKGVRAACEQDRFLCEPTCPVHRSAVVGHGTWD
jgi:predicted DNA-binding transcriptional regulator AlpA